MKKVKKSQVNIIKITWFFF